MTAYVRGHFAITLIALTGLYSGCMPYGETAVYQLYKTNADRCAQNEPDACVALLQSKCEAQANICTTSVPDMKAQASEHLSQKCQANDDASCQALDTLACDNGDAAVCSRLQTRYVRLYASCKATNPADCDSLSLAPWPKAQTDAAGEQCQRGDAIACRVANSSSSAMKVNVDRNTQFPMF